MKAKKGVYRWKADGRWNQVTKTMNLCKKLFTRDKKRGIPCEYGEWLNAPIPGIWLEESYNG